MPPDAGHGDPALRAAGGIGGLLAVHQAALDRPGTSNDVAAGDYGFTYDGNGNVVQVVNVSDYGYGNFHWQAVRTMAVYEYDAYGHVIGPDTSGDGQFDELDNVGPYAAENPIRFSTKYFDRETGLGYWGYRYYSPALGRWISRDPVEELGGANYYAYVMNGPVARFDARGLCVLGLTCGGNPFGPWGWPPYPEPDGPMMGGAFRPLPGDEDACEEGGPWDFPDCSDTPDCVLACTLGEAGGAAICYQGSPDSEPRPCTCDCYRVRERIREEAPDAYPPYNPPSKKGEDLVRRCIRHEEQRDAKNLPCYKGPRPKGSDTQCPGDIEQLKCLKDALRKCEGDQACKDMLYAQAKKQVIGCVTYGPNNPNRSGEYQRPCPPNEVTDCQNAFVDFEDEYLSGQGAR